jgi:hypothetical protein
MSCLLLRTALVAAVLLVPPACALAQTSASATASASVQIVDPVGILATAGASDAATASTVGAGVAQVSAGGFSLSGPANQVVSVSASLPASVQRVGGSETLPVTALTGAAAPSRTSTGAEAFQVAGATTTSGASGGVYTGAAQILVNLN